MMPAIITEGSPPGERELFRALASSPATEGWTVLHSLGIAEHVRQVEGEADFVVIVPHVGVLVIEVKSHQSVHYLDDGRWQLGTSVPISRGPFQQVKEAMHSIRTFLERKGVGTRGVPLIAAVWFTHVRARSLLPTSVEWHDWEVMDSEDLRSDPAQAILRTLRLGIAHLASRTAAFRTGSDQPDDRTAERLIRVLRPRFEMYVVRADMRRARQQQLHDYLDEQFEALDAMADNRAVLFTGPAGCGKTFLATEAARRVASVGGTGRLLCFNRLLGRQLSDGLESTRGLTVGTLHQEMLRIADVAPPANPTKKFWEEELPDQAMSALLDRPDQLVRGVLIVDEAQDVAAPQYLDVLDLMVDGGLSEGNVMLFGDFERQGIFESGDGRAALRERCQHLSSHRLSANCRNLPRIGYLTNTFSGLDPGYVRFRRTDDGVDPTFLKFESGADQSVLLVDAVQRLRGDGYELNEIVVLSPVRLTSVAETTRDSWLRSVLHEADGVRERPGQLRYATIQAFKGLEAPAVILTDLDQNLVPGFQSLLYVGLTRATDRLVALIEARTLRAGLGGFT
jgi:hypothetical protein